MELALGPPSPSPPQPGREQRVLWSQTSQCWALVWDRAPGGDASSRLEGMLGRGHPPPTPALTLPWRRLHWDGGLSNVVGSWGQERSCREVLQAGTGRESCLHQEDRGRSRVPILSFCGQGSPEPGPTTAGVPRAAPNTGAQPLPALPSWAGA